MPAALRIVPESALPLWQSHPWHQEIAAFRLPKKEVLTLQSAYITASRYLGPEQAEGGVYDANGRYVPSSRHLRRARDLTASNPEEIRFSSKVRVLSGRYLYLGWYFNHYGHFILESLGRSWAVQETPAVDGYIMHLHAAGGRPSPHLLAFFDLLGIPREKLLFADRDMQVGELLLPSQRAVLSRGISDDMLKLYRELGSRAAAEVGHAAVAPKLYLSRRLLPPDQRGASNEKALEERFQARGYRVVHPQFTDVKRQLALYSGAEYFAGLEGSGLHNVLFSQAPESVWMLGSKNHLADAVTQFDLDQRCGCTTELYLQSVPLLDCLHPRITPFVISSVDDNQSAVLTDMAPTAYDRFVWLSTLAAQLQRKQCRLDEDMDIFTAAERCLLKSLPVSPENAGTGPGCELTDEELALFLAVERHAVLGETATAVQKMAGCQERYSEHVPFLIRYVELLAADRQHEAALAVAKRAMALDADNPVLARLLASLLIQSGQREEAITVLQALQKSFPRYQPAGVLLTDVLMKEGRFREAAVALSAVIEDPEKHKGLLPRYTWSLFQSGDFEAARQAAHTALAHFPENPFSFVHLARIHLEMDEPEEALEWIGRAIERSPDKPELVQLRDRILGRIRQA
ncbi:tetratricopeptide repeat protein [Thiolapillus sp.]|uniref:tetratricopeptide repeat protein n=1 Tax=Thiolapillus sp. TaxID=2017437 RepID=UPI003AF959A9